MVHVLELVEPTNGVNVHELALKLPPALPSLHATVPVGIPFVPELESDIFTVNVTDVPRAALDGFGVITVLTVRNALADPATSAKDRLEIIITRKESVMIFVFIKCNFVFLLLS